MCCGLAVLAFLGPRTLLVVWWLARPVYFNAAFTSILWPILGIFLAPWTTIAYLLVSTGGVNGLDWFWVGLGVFADIASYSGSAYGNRDKIPGYHA